MTVIDRIRAILKSRTAISREMLEPLVEEYAERVGLVNERLQRCEGLLRKGLRSEAIQFAELEPRLLDQVAILDFPENEDWEEILRFYSLEVPTSLLMDIAIQLQDAMLSEQSLSAVLKQHRKLAIARAPLSWRLRVLRQIQRLDPGNANWSEDIESWEKVRLKELDREVEEAITKADLDSCERLREEIQSEVWSIHPPDALVKRLEERIGAFRVSKALKSLEVIAGRLNEAFCELDSRQGQQLARDWHSVAKGVPKIPRSLFQIAEPALAWLEEMRKEQSQREQFETLSQQLRESLNDRSKVTDVMRLHQSLVRLDLGIEPSLQRLYESFLENRRIEGQRRTRLVMAGLVGCLLIAAGLIGFTLWQRADSSRELAIVDQLKGLIEVKKFKEASSFVEQMNASAADMMKRPSITKMVEEVNQWKVQEEDRIKQFEDYLGKADGGGDSQIDLNSVVQAERLARSESEKGRAFALRKRFTEWENGVREKQKSDAEKELIAINSKITSIESMEAMSVDINAFDSLDNELSDLAAKYPKSGELIFGDIKLARKKLDDLEQSIREIKNRARMGAELVQDVRSSQSIEQLYGELKKFNERVTGVGLNPDFDAVLAEQDIRAIIEEWNQWAEKFDAFLKSSADNEEASRLADVWVEKLGDIEGFPAVALYPELASDLKMVGMRTDLIDEYFNTLADSLWSGIGTVVIGKTDGSSVLTRRFTYASKQKDIQKKSSDSINGKSVGIEVIVEADGTYGNWSPISEFSFVPEPFSLIESMKDEIERKRSSFEKNWEREWLVQIARIGNDANIDVMIKEELILQILDTMQKGSLILASSSNQAIDILKSKKRERENWFEASEYKTDLSKEIKDQFQADSRKIAERDSKFSAIASTRIGYAGVILPFQGKADSDSASAVISKSPESSPALSTTSGKYLFTVETLPDNAQLSYFRKDGTKTICTVIGSIESGTIKVDSASLKNIRFGTPIFTVTQ
ncbi:MAG: hypothetical protein RLY14_1129 [Planctomycetota bacterium]|jgi:hypothetical protein